MPQKKNSSGGEKKRRISKRRSEEISCDMGQQEWRDEGMPGSKLGKMSRLLGPTKIKMEASGSGAVCVP